MNTNIASTECGRSTPGHLPHFIQAKLALGSTATPLTLTDVTIDGITLQGATGPPVSWHLHRPARSIMRRALDRGYPEVLDYGTNFAVVHGIAISYVDGDADLEECTAEDVNKGGPIGHFSMR